MDIVVGILVAEYQNLFFTLGDAQFAPLDACKSLERRTCRPAAIRAVAIQGILEFIRYSILDCPAQALSYEYPTAIRFVV